MHKNVTRVYAYFIVSFLVGTMFSTMMVNVVAEDYNKDSTEEDTCEIKLTYTFSEPNLIKKNSYWSVELDDLDYEVETGKPLLPIQTVKVLLPYGHTVENISVITGDKRFVEGIYVLEWAQKPLPLSNTYRQEWTDTESTIYQQDHLEEYPTSNTYRQEWTGTESTIYQQDYLEEYPTSNTYRQEWTDTESTIYQQDHLEEYPTIETENIKAKELKIAPTPRNETLYSSSDPYPGILHDKHFIQNFRGYSILYFNLYPVHYLPKEGRIYYYDEFEIVVTTKDTHIHNALYRGLERDAKTIRQMIDNVDSITTYKLTQDTKEPMQSPLLDYDMVIITDNALNTSSGTYTFQDLADYRNTHGINTTIVTVESIYGNYSGTDNQEKIRNFIIDAYTNWGIEYVLLGGDCDGGDVGGESGDNIVPIRQIYVSSVYTDDIASDLYYACLDGNYNNDGDSHWGEPNDGPGGADVDLVAEVYVGRAPVDSETELSNFVMKTIAYEESQSPVLYDVWIVGEYLGFGGIADWGGNYKDEIKDGSSNHGYTTVEIPDYYNEYTLYDRDYPGNDWPPSEVINIINNGVNYINHLGHSDVGYAMKFYNPDADALTNTEYFFAYSQGCYCGSIDNRNTGGGITNYDSIAEHLVTEEHGAFAVIMNSRYGWGAPDTDGPSQRFDREFFDARYGEGIMQIGRANQDSKEDNLGVITGYSGLIRWCYFQTNLLGDPAVVLKDPIPLEHDISVTSLDAPDYLEPGDTTWVNATIVNTGMNNENNINVNFTVDGNTENNTLIAVLNSGASAPVSFQWTPATEANYVVGIEVTPIPDENYTGNNEQHKTISVRNIKGYILFDQTHSTDSISSYSDWVTNITNEGYIVETHDSGVIDAGALSGYDVFVIPQSMSSYTSSELTVIQNFVSGTLSFSSPLSSGGGLFLIGDSDDSAAYTDITGFAGISWLNGGSSGTTSDITSHEITEGVSSVYFGSPVKELQVSGDALDIIRNSGDILFAISENPGRVVGIGDENTLWNGNIDNADNKQLAHNIIKWLVGELFEHDVEAMSIDAPDTIPFTESAYVNATIRNKGTNDETSINVNFTVDGVVEDNTTIPFLANGTTTNVSFFWTPPAEGSYNVGIEVTPIPNENDTSNNQKVYL